eukprot:7557453-Pyramimonas_sp.AAC.1
MALRGLKMAKHGRRSPEGPPRCAKIPLVHDTGMVAGWAEGKYTLLGVKDVKLQHAIPVPYACWNRAYPSHKDRLNDFHTKPLRHIFKGYLHACLTYAALKFGSAR